MLERITDPVAAEPEEEENPEQDEEEGMVISVGDYYDLLMEQQEQM